MNNVIDMTKRRKGQRMLEKMLKRCGKSALISVDGKPEEFFDATSFVVVAMHAWMVNKNQQGESVAAPGLKLAEERGYTGTERLHSAFRKFDAAAAVEEIQRIIELVPAIEMIERHPFMELVPI